MYKHLKERLLRAQAAAVVLGGWVKRALVEDEQGIEQWVYLIIALLLAGFGYLIVKPWITGWISNTTNNTTTIIQ